MWRDIRELYARAFAFSQVSPLLFLIPVLAEAAQHLAEIRIGMYDGWEGARASAEASSRLAWGFVKTLAMLLPGYWFIRYLHWNDPSRAGAVERPAVWLFLVIVGLQGLIQAFTLFGPGGAGLGLDESSRGVVIGAMVILQTVATVYLTAWLVAWPLGNPAIGPVRSLRIMTGGFWRTMGYVLAGFLPLMVVHYALGMGAIGRPRGLVWAMLALDAVVVGYLALAVTGAAYMAARHAAARKGIALAG